MKDIFIANVIHHIGKEVRLSGWATHIRDHKKVIFIDLRDSSGVVQLVGDETIRGISPEDVISILGIVKKRPEKLINPKLKTGLVEVEVKDCMVISRSEKLPFDMGKEQLELTLPTLLDYRGLTLRHPAVSSIFKVQETVIDAFRSGLKHKKFTEFQSPVIIPETAEGGADVFEVKYFGHRAYLSQSPQFYKQIMVGVFERVFTVNKTLRAEPSVTTRHLAEVTTLDVEFGFIDAWTEVMDVAEEVIKYIIKEIGRFNGGELALHKASLPKVGGAIPRLKLKEAQKIIFSRSGKDARGEPDLSPEDEREIGAWARDEKASDFVFITHYPVNKRPFYTHEDPKDPGYTLSFDLLGRGMEWCTGGQRIHDLSILLKKAHERGINIAKSELYLQAFRYGMPPEGGFSFGSERIVMGILGLKNVREASLFPRDMERVDVRL